ncbi:MAG: hypothetical protein AAF228_12510, partial [Pseudomonadota bacterium]
MSSEYSIDPYSSYGDSSFYDSDTTETFQSALRVKSSVAFAANTTAPANASASGSTDPDFAFKLAPEAFDIFFGDKTYHGNNFSSDAGVSTSFSSAFYLESSNGGNPPQGRYAVGIVSLNGENQMVMVDKEAGDYTIIDKAELAEHGITIDSITGEIALAEGITFLEILNGGTLSIIQRNQYGGDQLSWSYDFAEHSPADTFNEMLVGKQAHAEDNTTLSFNETLDPAEYLEIDDQFYFSSAKIDGEYVWFLTDKDTGEITFVDFSSIKKFYVEVDADAGTIGILNEGYQLEVVTVLNEDGTSAARVQVSTEGGSVPWYSDVSGSYLNVFNGSHTVVPIYFEGLTSIGPSLTTGDAMIAGGTKYIESPDGFFRGVLTIDGGLLIIDTRTFTIIEQIETGAVGGGLKLFSNGELKSYKSGDNEEDGVPLGTGNDAVDSNTFELQLNGGAFQIVDTRFDPTQDDGLLWDSSLVTDKTDWTIGVVGMASELFTGTDLGSELATGDVLKAGDGNFLSISEDTDGDGTVDVNYRTTLLSDGRLLTYDMISKTVVTEATIDTGLKNAVLEVRSDGVVYIYSADDDSLAFDTGTRNENTNRNTFSFSLEIYTDNKNTETARLSLYDAQENAVLWTSDEGTLGKAADNPASGGGSKEDPSGNSGGSSGGSSSSGGSNGSSNNNKKSSLYGWLGFGAVVAAGAAAGAAAGSSGGAAAGGAPGAADAPGADGVEGASRVVNQVGTAATMTWDSTVNAAAEAEVELVTTTQPSWLADGLEAAAQSFNEQLAEAAQLAQEAAQAAMEAETPAALEEAAASAAKAAEGIATAVKTASAVATSNGLTALAFSGGTAALALAVVGLTYTIGLLDASSNKVGSNNSGSSADTKTDSSISDIQKSLDEILSTLVDTNSVEALNDALTTNFEFATSLNDRLWTIAEGQADVEAPELQSLKDVAEAFAPNYAKMAKALSDASSVAYEDIIANASNSSVKNPLLADNSDETYNGIYSQSAAKLHVGLADTLLSLANDATATDGAVAKVNPAVIEGVDQTVITIETTALELAQIQNLSQLQKIRALFEQQQSTTYFEELPQDLKDAVSTLLEQVNSKLNALGEDAVGAKIDEASVGIANQAAVVAKQLETAAAGLLEKAQESLGELNISIAEIAAYSVSKNLENLSNSYVDASDKIGKISEYTNQIQLLGDMGKALTEFVSTQIYTAEQQFNTENPRSDITDPIKTSVDKVMQALQNLNTTATNALQIDTQINKLLQDATDKLYALVKTQIPELSKLYTQVYGLQELAAINDELFKDKLALDTAFKQITSDTAALNDTKAGIIANGPEIAKLTTENRAFKYLGAGALSIAAPALAATLLAPNGTARIAPIFALIGSPGMALNLAVRTFLNEMQISRKMSSVTLPQINAARFLNDPRTITTLSDPNAANAGDQRAAVIDLFNNMGDLVADSGQLSNREYFDGLINQGRILDRQLSQAIKQLFNSDMIPALVASSSSEVSMLLNQLTYIIQEIEPYSPLFPDLQNQINKVIVDFAAAQLNSSAQPTSHQQKASRQVSTNLAQIATDETKDQENIFASELATLDDFMDFWVAGQIAPLTALVQEYISDASTDEEIAAVISNVTSDYGLDAATYMKDTLNGNHQLTPELREADEAIRTMASKMADLVSYDAIADGYTAEDARALANETYDDMIESYFPIYGSNIAEQLALAVMDQLGSDDNVKRLAMA